MDKENKNETLSDAQMLNKLQMRLHGFDVKYILDLDKEALTDTELKARANELEVPYTRWLKKVIDTFAVAQMTAMSEKAVSNEDLAFMRGAISGFIVLQQWFQQQLSLSKARFQKDE